MEKGSSSISNPIPSSTVILIRDVGKGPEILLVLRHKKASFGANYVFPGGTLESIDELTLNNDAVRSEKMNNILGLSSGGPAYYSAAIRELFEEVGILLVYKADNSGIDNKVLESYRDKLNNGCISWVNFLHHNHLLLDYNSLHYFSFWITPLGIPKRYTTRFFLALLPKDQLATHCGGELVDSCWMSANDALIANQDGDISIPYPTLVTLRQMSEFNSLQSLLNWADERAKVGVPCYFPSMHSDVNDTRLDTSFNS